MASSIEWIAPIRSNVPFSSRTDQHSICLVEVHRRSSGRKCRSEYNADRDSMSHSKSWFDNRTTIVERRQMTNTTANPNRCFFGGTNTTIFTVTEDFFLAYPSVKYWRFEVLLPTNRSSTNGLGMISFFVNQPPINGICQIDLLNETATIRCAGCVDTNRIQDYAAYLLTRSSAPLMLDYSTSPEIQLELPTGHNFN